MTHSDYIKQRDEILEGISIGISGEYPHNATITLRGADQAAQAIDALVLQVIGEEEKNWIGPRGDTHNVPTDGMVSRNELRIEQRKTVQGYKS